MGDLSTLGEFLEGMFAVATDVFTVLAILAGGIWFYQRRERYPKAHLTHQIHSTRLPRDLGWALHVSVTIENRGRVLLDLRSGVTRIQQIEPVPEIVLQACRAHEDPVPEGQSEVLWDGLGERHFPTNEHPAKIEPGESDQIAYDFFVPADVRTVQVYTHYPNQRTSGTSGWQLTTVHEIAQTAHAESEADE